jgi:hypothetical protein
VLNKISGMTLKDRLQEFLTSKSLSQGRFEKSVKLSTGFVNNIGDGISTQSLIKILESYPDLNATWLLTGHGEMILTEKFLMNEGAEGYKKEPATVRMPVQVLLLLKTEIATMQSSLSALSKVVSDNLPEGNTGDHPATEDLQLDKKKRTLKDGKKRV